MCGYECCISSKSIHSSLLSWSGWYITKTKYNIWNYQNRMSGEKSNSIYETYKNIIIPHWRHIYAKAYDIEKVTMYAYQQSDHTFNKLEICIAMLCQMSMC